MPGTQLDLVSVFYAHLPFTVSNTPDGLKGKNVPVRAAVILFPRLKDR